MKHAPPFEWIPRGGALERNSLEAAESGLPPILLELLARRGIAAGAELESFLRPMLRDLSDPFLLGGMTEAVERILQAVDQQQRVCIFGDYDVDGVTSVALMLQILRAYGLMARPFIPRRSTEGYGLSEAAIHRCMSEGEKPDLLITVDCGTVSVDQIAALQADGVDVVVIDHHEPLPGLLPACHALVNPKYCGHLPYLCAAGVVFKLGHALLKRRTRDFDLRQVLDLVAVATISDIVPMVGENRLLVRHGLQALTRTLNPGLRALQEVTGMHPPATSMDVGFRIGPRLNAAGRMDQPEDALAMLTTECRREAHELAQKLDAYNRQRQQEEARIRREAQLCLATGFDPQADPVIVLASRDWHHGVVGIVASRLMRQYHKPTFVIAIDDEGLGKGSGRSIEGVSLVEAIRDCGDILVAGGGHGMAAGISIHEDQVDEFRRKFAAHVLGQASAEARRPRLLYDAEITFDQLSLEFLASYELLQPFGNGNPQPVFIARGVGQSQKPQIMKNHHLRFKLSQGYHQHDAVFFGGGEREPLPQPPWDVAFTVDRNTFRGRTTLQLIIQDMRPVERLSNRHELSHR